MTLAIGLAAICSHTRADEIVFGQDSQTVVRIGDFACSRCDSQLASALSLNSDRNAGEITAGELWQFFHREGITSVRKISLCVDVDPCDSRSQLELSQVRLQIQGANSESSTVVDLGDDSIVIPGYEITAFKPEARLEFDLGYDFMDRFDAESQAKIKIDFVSTDQSNTPVFLIVSNQPIASASSLNFALLAGFVAFWVMVFVLVSRVTRPVSAPELAKKLSVPAARPAGSVFSS